MKLVKQIKKDLETLKNIPTKERKLSFIIEYYGIMISVIVIVLALLISTTFKIAFADKTILYTVLVNSDALIVECDDTIFDQLMLDSGLDMHKKKVDINKDLYLGINQNEEEDVKTLQVLTALFSISDLDIFIGDEKSFKIFADEDAFANLKLLLTPDILNKYQNDFYKIKDQSGNEIVVGIILHKDSIIHNAGYYHDDVVIGIANNAANFDNALSLLNQILK